jgi:putative ABC transport system permease protein
MYPATFRERYRDAIERQFEDEYREASTPTERAALCLRATRDLATSVPAEFSRELAQDLKYAFRMHRKRPLSTVLAVAALGLAIGACTGVFSVLNALLLRTLPFQNPEQLVELHRPPVTAGKGRAAFHEWASQSPYLTDAAAFSASDMNLSLRHGALRVRVAETSANFLELLGTPAVFGRAFTAGEDAPGRTRVAVISHSLWHQLFGGSPAALGGSVHLNGTPLTIIGVAPPKFDYPSGTSVWMPTVFDFENVPKHGAFFFQTIGRLKPDLTVAQSRRLFEAEVQRDDPESLRADEPNRARILSIRDELSGPIRRAGWVLSAMILLVLLTACANVAHLLLSRITERRQELALRTALGASRARLIQQLTTEAAALTLTGAAAGLLVAHWASQLASAVAPPQLAVQQYTILDWRVVAFAASLAVVTGIIFGVLPFLLLGRMHASIRSTLLAVQAGLTIVLLASSGALGQTFLQLLDTDLGFRAGNVVTMSVSTQGTKYRGAALWQYYSEALARLSSTSGVLAAGAVSYLPLATKAYMAGSFKLDSGQTIERVVTNAATPDYFRAMGTSFLAGGDFGRGQPSDPVVIVNEAFARTTSLGTRIIGRSITANWSDTPYRIAGVVETSRAAGPSHQGTPMIYWPVEEEPPPNLTFVARVEGDAGASLARCRDALVAVDRQVPVHDVRTLEQRLAEVLARPRFFTTATLFLTVVALFLAALGIFGTAAHAVAQRSREMGIRMALGASYGRLRTMLLRESIAPVVLGAGAGIALALSAGRYLEHLVSGVRPIEAWTCAAAALLLAAALTAAWRATARLLAIQPAEAVRSQ